jgi:hypothetical protein
VPVLCVTRARHVERIDGEVLIVSLDRLVSTLRAAAGIGPPIAAATVAASSS